MAESKPQHHVSAHPGGEDTDSEDEDMGDLTEMIKAAARAANEASKAQNDKDQTNSVMETTDQGNAEENGDGESEMVT